MPKKSPTILVIDDERDTLTILRLALEKAGFTVFVAESWHEASNLVKKVYSDHKSIDLIVLDLVIPDRSGFDILRSLQVVITPLPPVIMLSAVTGFEQQVEARQLGASRYLTKPTTPRILVDAINEVIADHYRE